QWRRGWDRGCAPGGNLADLGRLRPMRITLAVPFTAAAFACASSPGKQSAPRQATPSASAQSTSPADQVAKPADLVFRGGKVFVAIRQVASSIAVRGERVAAVGAEAERLVGPSTRVIDLQGRLATPGMHDAHCHLAPGGGSMLEVDLRRASFVSAI